MRLSTKLFLFVGALVLVICLAIYFVPAYITARELIISRQEFLTSVKKQREEDWQSNMDWLALRTGDREGWVDASLLFALGHPEGVLDELFIPTPAGKNAPSLAASRVLASSPHITYLEAVTDEKFQLGVTLSRASLLTVKKFPVDRGVAWMLLDETGEEGELVNRVYVGVWVPSRLQEQVGGHDGPGVGHAEIFLLFDPLALYHYPEDRLELTEEEKGRLKELKVGGVSDPLLMVEGLVDRLQEAKGELRSNFLSEAELVDYMKGLEESGEKVSFQDLLGLPDLRVRGKDLAVESRVSEPTGSIDEQVEETEEAIFHEELAWVLRRRDNVELTSALGIFSSTDVLWKSPFDQWAPAGAAHFFPGQGKGTGVLTAEVFNPRPLFDAAAHMRLYPPVYERIPIASNFALLPEDEAGTVTLVNSLRFVHPEDPKRVGYLTVGATLTESVSRLARATGQVTLLLHKGRVVISRVPGGDEVRGLIGAIEQDPKVFTGRIGFVALDGVEYYYSVYRPRENWDLAFVTLEPAEKVLAPAKRFEAYSREVAQRLSWHILAVAAGVFVLALIVLEIIARQFTKPMRQLARATEAIREGRYDQVELPEVSKGGHNEVSILTRSFRDMVEGLADREKMRSVLDKVVSPEIAKEILSGKVHLGGEVKDVTVFFADIREFTSLSANLPPQEVITFVNDYMTRMSGLIESHHGVIDKFIGDALMALFGAPVEFKYSTVEAVLAALAIREDMVRWNEERRAEGKLTAEIGIGIHSGAVVAGNMGAEDRLNYTVLGSNVNLAARLCHKSDGMEILITEHVLQNPLVADTIAVEKREPVSLKGYAEPVQAYRVVGLRSGYTLEEVEGLIAQGRELPPTKDSE